MFGQSLGLMVETQLVNESRDAWLQQSGHNHSCLRVLPWPPSS